MLKQVFIINKDLGMRTGKIATQIAHAETLYMEDIISAHVQGDVTLLYKKYKQWKLNAIKPIGVMTKIVKKATYRELLEIMHTLDNREDIKYYSVYDLGNTQVKTGSLTCICTEPIEQEIADKLFGELKLL